MKGRDGKCKKEPHGKKDYYPPADSPGRLEMLIPLALGVGVVDIWPRQGIESNSRSILTPDSTSPPPHMGRGVHTTAWIFPFKEEK